MHILVILPAIVLGVLGGLLGALFTRLNTYVVSKRKQFLAKLQNQTVQGCIRCVETLLIVVGVKPDSYNNHFLTQFINL